MGYRSLKRVLCKHEASVSDGGGNLCRAQGQLFTLRHEQNYTYDPVTLKEGIAQLGSMWRIRPETREKAEQVKVWPPRLLNADAVKVSRVWQNVLI